MNHKNPVAAASFTLATLGLLGLASASGCSSAPDAPVDTPDAAQLVDAGVDSATPDTGTGTPLEAGACLPGTADCDGDPRNGCETTISTDPKNCGVCKHDCTGLPHVSGATTCEAGKCVVPATSCAMGYAHCSSHVEDGCEADLTKAATCGSCTTACSGATSVCANGSCGSGCPSNAPTQCSGSCVDTTQSATNCATCGHACASPTHGQATCASSTCGFACNSGYHACGAGCADNTDPMTCGSSCTPCTAPANGVATCNGGSCGFTCNAGFHACGATCVSDSDATACGASCTVCSVPGGAGHATCASNMCGVSCDSGNHLCGTNCANNGDVATCGASCTPCAAPPGNGHAACDGTSCSIACDASFHLCGGNCDSNTSTASCGSSCTPCPLPANAQSTTCDGTTCGFTCSAGYANCDGNAANGCEVQLASDSGNCGACGHSCLGGACSASACQPILLVSTLGITPHAISPSITADFVGYTDGSALPSYKVIHKDGSSVGSVSITNVVNTAVNDGTTIYVSSGYSSGAGEIWSIPALNPSAATRIFNDSTTNPDGLAFGGSTILIWTDARKHTVGQMLINGQNVFPSLYTAPAPTNVTGALVTPNDYSYVAWLETSARLMVSTNTLVSESPIATFQAPKSLALDATYLYVTDATSGIIWRISRATNQMTALVTQQSGASGIAVDANNVYWTVNGSLMRAPINGGTPVTLAHDSLTDTGEIKLDNTAIYWGIIGDLQHYGKLMKLAK